MSNTVRSIAAFVTCYVLTSSALADILTFENLPTPPAVTGDVAFAIANGGSRTLSGVTFEAAANADWEIIGNQYRPPFSSDFFAVSHSGTFVLAGNAYAGFDLFGNEYTGLTLSTTKLLSGLYVGYDNDGGGSNDADSLTITAYGASGDLAAFTTILAGPSLSHVDLLAQFSALSSITGYRFETTAADLLNAAAGRAYLIADDLTFGTTASVPEPDTIANLALGFTLLGALDVMRRRSKTAKAT